ncbi:hypothetical protein FRC02_011750 [Tulasnella sp. 418]|nr:hypothetical protein FRC02_011750 [Tulasnella sp. 418]
MAASNPNTLDSFLASLRLPISLPDGLAAGGGWTKSALANFLYIHECNKLRLRAVCQAPAMPEMLTNSFKQDYGNNSFSMILAEKVRQAQNVGTGWDARRSHKNEEDTATAVKRELLDPAFLAAQLTSPEKRFAETSATGSHGRCDRLYTAILDWNDDSSDTPILTVEYKYCSAQSCLLQDLTEALARNCPFRFDPPKQPSTRTADDKRKKLEHVNYPLKDGFNLARMGLAAPSDDTLSSGVDIKQRVKSVLHQVWVQLVVHDATFGVLTDYNKTLILFRSRETQTLYISRPVKWDSEDPRAITLLVSTFRAALDDVIERGRRGFPTFHIVDLDDEMPGGSSRHGGGDGSNNDGDGDNAEDGESRPEKRIKTNDVNHHSGPQGNVLSDIPCFPYPTGAFLVKRQFLAVGEKRKRENHWFTFSAPPSVLHLYFCTPGIYDSESPAILMLCPSRNVQHLSENAVTTSKATQTFNSPLTRGINYHDDKITTGQSPSKVEVTPTVLVLTQEMGPTKCSDQEDDRSVWRGYIDTGSVTVAVTVKLGDWLLLNHEWNIYQRLRQKEVQGIPSCLGLYNVDGFPSLGALVLSYNGNGIDLAKVTGNAQSSYLGILQSIHASGVLHQDLDQRHLLQNVTGAISIIDFDNAATCSEDNGNLKDLSGEMNEFQSMLHSAS